MEKITYDEISKQTGVSKPTISKHSKETGYTGEKLLNYIKNNVIGIDDGCDKETYDYLNKNGLKILELDADMPKNLYNNIVCYNQIIKNLSLEDLNHSAFIKYTSQLLAYDKRIDEIKKSLGIVEGVKSAIED